MINRRLQTLIGARPLSQPISVAKAIATPIAMLNAGVSSATTLFPASIRQHGSKGKGVGRFRAEAEADGRGSAENVPEFNVLDIDAVYSVCSYLADRSFLIFTHKQILHITNLHAIRYRGSYATACIICLCSQFSFFCHFTSANFHFSMTST